MVIFLKDGSRLELIGEWQTNRLRRLSRAIATISIPAFLSDCPSQPHQALRNLMS